MYFKNYLIFYYSTPEDLDAILSCNLRIVSLRLKFRNYFLKHDEPIKETFKNMEKYIDHLSPTQCIILARVIVRTGHPQKLYNDLVQHLKKLGMYLFSCGHHVVENLYYALFS